MDNLTHSLIGAALGQAGLKRKTGLAMPALIIAANIPDIDGLCMLLGDMQHLSLRRGITHGPIAMAVLPLVLAGVLSWFDHWQTQRGTRPDARLPVNFRWLLALCYLGTFTHPLFDWFNNYGIRLLEPFSDQWFYGDTLFIIDPWIWAMLGAGVWLSRRREKAETAKWQRPALAAVAGLILYTSANMVISSVARSVAASDAPYAEINVTSPVPAAFWRRQILWRSGDTYGFMSCGWAQCQRYPIEPLPTNMKDPRIALWAKGNRQAESFLFWSRMPVAELHDDRIVLSDQRFMSMPGRSGFVVTLRPPAL